MGITVISEKNISCNSMTTKYFINTDTGVVLILDPASAKRNGLEHHFDKLYRSYQKKKSLVEVNEDDANNADRLNRFTQVGKLLAQE